VYIGACVGHWKQLSCFMVPSPALWGIDRALCLVRTALLHRNGGSRRGMFAPADAQVTLFAKADADDDDVVRFDLKHAQSWTFDQHFFFYLCFVDSAWQPHPFTPLGDPATMHDGQVAHSYVFRDRA